MEGAPCIYLYVQYIDSEKVTSWSLSRPSSGVRFCLSGRCRRWLTGVADSEDFGRRMKRAEVSTSDGLTMGGRPPPGITSRGNGGPSKEKQCWECALIEWGRLYDAQTPNACFVQTDIGTPKLSCSLDPDCNSWPLFFTMSAVFRSAERQR